MVTAPTRDDRRACARYIHDKSVRRGRPFVAVSCSATPPAGAEWFSPVARDTGETIRAWFGRARGGTLFLDDVGSLGWALRQELTAAMCDPLQTRHDAHEVRVVTGARPSWPSRTERERFSERLYYRLNVMRVDLVQEAREDLPEFSVNAVLLGGLPQVNHVPSALLRGRGRAGRGR